jgi:hypothetical protein
VAYGGVVAGRPVKGANANVDTTAPLCDTSGDSGGGTGEDLKSSGTTLPENMFPRGENDVTVFTKAGRRLVTRPPHQASQEGRSSPQKRALSLSVPVALLEAVLRLTSPGYLAMCADL